MRKKLYRWEVFRLKGSPAAFIGLVHAPDEKSAQKAAAKEFNISPEHQKRLLIRRV
jgi:1,2-phenylacetyl-CoA epoxidase PaaB subunit